MQLLIEQRFAFRQQAQILFPKDVAPGHVGIGLADEIRRLRQARLLREGAVGKQVAPIRIPAEDIHG